MAKEPGGCGGREWTDVPVFREDRARNSRDPRHAEAPLGHNQRIWVQRKNLNPCQACAAIGGG